MLQDRQNFTLLNISQKRHQHEKDVHQLFMHIICVMPKWSKSVYYILKYHLHQQHVTDVSAMSLKSSTKTLWYGRNVWICSKSWFWEINSLYLYSKEIAREALHMFTIILQMQQLFKHSVFKKACWPHCIYVSYTRNVNILPIPSKMSEAVFHLKK